MIIYSVVYDWVDTCNNRISIMYLVTEDFNKALECVSNKMSKEPECECTIKKWINGEVISEYIVDKNGIKTIEDIED